MALYIGAHSEVLRVTHLPCTDVGARGPRVVMAQALRDAPEKVLPFPSSPPFAFACKYVWRVLISGSNAPPTPEGLFKGRSPPLTGGSEALFQNTQPG